jgi:chaperone required for assembly of F1-ATPase
MTDDRAPDMATLDFVPVDPYALTRREAAASQIKRFYKAATIAERQLAYAVLLDGRPVKTPARADVALSSSAAAQALADEWNRQGEMVQPGDMPLTRLVNSVIDGVATAMDEVRAEVVKFAGSDLLCYRADQPATLVALQAQEWDPVIAWVRDDLDARLYLAEGVMFVAQPDHALAAIDRAVRTSLGEGRDAAFRLGALHVMTTLTGSALLALAVLRGALTAEEAWRKAHVDEDFQISQWGEDAEAAVRRRRRWQDMAAAASLVAALA